MKRNRSISVPIGDAKEIVRLLKKVARSRRTNAALKRSILLKVERLENSLSKPGRVENIRIRLCEFLSYIKALASIVAAYKELMPFISAIIKK